MFLQFQGSSLHLVLSNSLGPVMFQVSNLRLLGSNSLGLGGSNLGSPPRLLGRSHLAFCTARTSSERAPGLGLPLGLPHHSLRSDFLATGFSTADFLSSGALLRTCTTPTPAPVPHTMRRAATRRAIIFARRCLLVCGTICVIKM
eukprot:TRINITY_DN8800_c0_g1_i1.p1 TRINITY_DN8800_c0_g1~~TRINITY_DN8800_c0_g1_i1.p1  ORF type:complete len:145 (-),score=3.17 TRINITY_DN8800_c0_g1_i1:110-544(-)